MRGWQLLPLALVVLVVIGLPVAAFTDTGLENDARDALGIESGDCVPMTNEESAWREGPALPLDLDEPRGATIDGQIYLAGGITGLEVLPNDRLLLEPSDGLLRFDPRSGEYTELAPMPRALNHMGVTTYGGDLYVLGGYGKTLEANTSKDFFRYDVAADRWTSMPDLPRPLAAMALGIVGDRLIVAGGARDSVPVTDAFAFDFRRGRWSELPPLPGPREHVGSIGIGDELYVFGGRTPKSFAVRTAASFDASEGRWRSLPPMPVGSGGLGVVDAGGRPVAVGGGNDLAETVTGAVQELAPDGKWVPLPDLRTPRHGHGTVVADGKIWVFGGSPCAYFNATDNVEWLPVPH
ncbi:MAG TPA: kelch repeat-containing protein [Solirubrobacterales bacterium]|jgi:hypothetical protein